MAKIRLVILIGILVLASLYGWREFNKKTTTVKGIPAVGGKVMKLSLDAKPIYLQSDSKWSKETIGGSGETIQAVGCTVSSVSMALAHYNIDMNPSKLNKLLKDHGDYTRQGWLIWNKIQEVTRDKVVLTIPVNPTYELIDQALEKRQPVVANVIMNGSILHWVLIMGKEGQEYLIKDPLGIGRIEKLSKFKSDIYAIRIVQKS